MRQARSYTFEVEGDPIPKGRPRVYGRHAITPKRTLDYEKTVLKAFKTQNPGATPFTGPVRVDVVFRRRTRRRSDVDNLLKTLLDALNGAAWEDDDQVYHSTATRLRPGEYPAGKEPGMSVAVTEVPDITKN